MEKIRLIAVDVDGTLLDDRKELPAANREALLAASRAGVLVTIASGRMTPRIEAIESRLGVDCVILAYNGGKVVSPRREGREVIVHQPVPPDVASELIDYSHDTGLLLNFYHEEVLFGRPGGDRDRMIDLYTARTGAAYVLEQDYERLRGIAPTKLILLADPPEVERLLEAFRERFAGRAFITRSDPEYLEITAPDVNKGTALRLLARHYDTPLANVMALGDADNDLGLIETAGFGVAVANAHAHVKAAAAAVTQRTNNEGAVAEAIDRWVLGGEDITPARELTA